MTCLLKELQDFDYNMTQTSRIEITCIIAIHVLDMNRLSFSRSAKVVIRQRRVGPQFKHMVAVKFVRIHMLEIWWYNDSKSPHHSKIAINETVKSQAMIPWNAQCQAN